MFAILFGFCLLLWTFAFFFLYRIPLCKLEKNQKSFPTTSIIIPARNEEKNLPVLLSSISGQRFQPTEIIVVDDHSEDKTADIASTFGARVIQSRRLPKGWVGKTWACYQGAEAASGELFIFLDSDTMIEEDGFEKIVGTWLQNQDSVLSIGPYHRTERFYEQFSAFFNLMMMAGMNAFTPINRRIRPTGLFGPSMIVSREHYYSVGGHAHVKDKILEDLFLGDSFIDAGIPLKILGGRGTLSFRMYPDGMVSLINGWSKSFATGAQKTSALAMVLIVLWTVGSLLTIIFGKAAFFLGLFSPFGPWFLLQMMYALQIYWIFIRIGTFRWYTALFYPLPLLFFFAVFTRSIIMVKYRKNVQWKSRNISLSGEE